MMVATRDVHVPGVGACRKGSVLADDEPLVTAARAGSFVTVLEERPKRTRKAAAALDDETPDDVEVDD